MSRIKRGDNTRTYAMSLVKGAHLPIVHPDEAKPPKGKGSGYGTKAALAVGRAKGNADRAERHAKNAGRKGALAKGAGKRSKASPKTQGGDDQ